MDKVSRLWNGNFLINTFNQQGCNKLIKHDRKDIYKVTKDFYLKLMQFFSTFYSKNPEKNDHGSHKNIKQHNCLTSVIKIDNNK